MAILLFMFTAFYAKTTMPAKRSFGAPARTACAIVTRADVESATGRAVSDGEEANDGPTSTCEYAGKGGGLVSITIQKLERKPDLRLEVAALQKEFPESAVREATGFGEAVYLDLPGAGTQLHLINGSSGHLMVSVLGLGEAPKVAGAAAAIARRALRRL